MAIEKNGSSEMTWPAAIVRAAILLVAAIVVFLVVPDRLLAYLSLHVAPGVRDLLVTAWMAVGFCGVAAFFVGLQRRGRT
jgi:hypothetical protein